MIFPQQERRVSPRIDLVTPIRWQIRGRPECQNGLTENISACGLGFKNMGFVAPRTMVMVELNLFSRILHPIGTIKWASPLSHADKFRLGVEFIEMDPGEKTYLREYLDMHLSNNL